MYRVRNPREGAAGKKRRPTPLPANVIMSGLFRQTRRRMGWILARRCSRSLVVEKEEEEVTTEVLFIVEDGVMKYGGPGGESPSCLAAAPASPAAASSLSCSTAP